MSRIVLPTGDVAERPPVELSATVGPSTAEACRWMDDRKIAAWYVRWAAGRTLLDEILPLIERGTSWAALPVERIGDGYLSIIRDWLGFPAHTAASVAIRLERLIAKIEAEQKQQAIERAAATSEPRRPPSRPTRKGKQKRRPKAGRR